MRLIGEEENGEDEEEAEKERKREDEWEKCVEPRDTWTN